MTRDDQNRACGRPLRGRGTRKAVLGAGFLVETMGVEPPTVARHDPQGAYSTWGPQQNTHRGSFLGGAIPPTPPLTTWGSLRSPSSPSGRGFDPRTYQERLSEPKRRTRSIFPGGDDGSRTHDLRNASAALSQLSYVPTEPNTARAARIIAKWVGQQGNQARGRLRTADCGLRIDDLAVRPAAVKIARSSLVSFTSPSTRDCITIPDPTRSSSQYRVSSVSCSTKPI